MYKKNIEILVFLMSIHDCAYFIYQTWRKRIIEIHTCPAPAVFLQDNNTRFASLEYVDVLIPVSICTFTPWPQHEFFSIFSPQEFYRIDLKMSLVSLYWFKQYLIQTEIYCMGYNTNCLLVYTKAKWKQWDTMNTF